ncbi:iron chelate uptake ABC transporter family permease subunit [Mycoplasmoides alvi]|uniref:iron chelate uptake ABC transporter family permease subunit n=1 Tax=Mycoplasmoides alvi TaxID=78580 RepID=UPI00051B1B22|nr:iron chelate uptake ABC transporter family permease subunit [Mycoplasmoides alvi]
MFLKKRNLKYISICIILFFITIAVVLLAFSISSNGSIVFLASITTNKMSYLTIGIGVIASIIAAIAFNSSGELAQSSTRNILASPFTLGLVPVMTLSYLISNLISNLKIWEVGLLAFAIIFFINILPIYFISKSKYKLNQNAIIFYGLSISILITSIIAILNFLTQIQQTNIFGWMIISTVTLTNEKLFYGATFFIVGLFILVSISKKIYMYENAYFKATSLSINLSLLNMLSLVSISLMCIGGFIAYAPFTLLGFAIPFLTKKYLIKNYDFRFSLLPSTLLSIIITVISYITNCFLHANIDVVMIIFMLPFTILMFLEKRINAH